MDEALINVLRMPNKQFCDVCGTECVDRCFKCGAPQCCPKCCDEALSQRFDELDRLETAELEKERDRE